MTEPKAPASPEESTDQQGRLSGDWLEGRTLGKYKLIKRIGAGAFASIYEAEHVHLQVPFAIKVLHPAFAGREEIVKRFFREAQAASQLQHENVVFIADFAVAEGVGPYIVMEYLEGETLKSCLEREQSLPLSQVGEISRQICQALALAHRKGIIHRDLKPENIFLIRREMGHLLVKILDFGIAHLAAARDSITGARLMGTPVYMAPEQFRGQVNSEGLDIYSFGVILYEMLVGQPPFKGQSVQRLGIEHLLLPAPPLDDHYPHGLRQLQARLLGKTPEERPSSMEETWMLLSEAIDPEHQYPHWHQQNVFSSPLMMAVPTSGTEPLPDTDTVISKLPQFPGDRQEEQATERLPGLSNDDLPGLEEAIIVSSNLDSPEDLETAANDLDVTLPPGTEPPLLFASDDDYEVTARHIHPNHVAETGSDSHPIRPTNEEMPPPPVVKDASADEESSSDDALNEVTLARVQPPPEPQPLPDPQIPDAFLSESGDMLVRSSGIHRVMVLDEEEPEFDEAHPTLSPESDTISLRDSEEIQVEQHTEGTAQAPDTLGLEYDDAPDEATIPGRLPPQAAKHDKTSPGTLEPPKVESSSAELGPNDLVTKPEATTSPSLKAPTELEAEGFLSHQEAAAEESSLAEPSEQLPPPEPLPPPKPLNEPLPPPMQRAPDTIQQDLFPLGSADATKTTRMSVDNKPSRQWLRVSRREKKLLLIVWLGALVAIGSLYYLIAAEMPKPSVKKKGKTKRRVVPRTRPQPRPQTRRRAAAPLPVRQLSQALRKVVIDCEPNPAQVFMSNELLGQTPLTLPLEMNRKVTLVVRKTGFQEQTLEFTVNEDKSQGNTVICKLRPKAP